MRSENMHSRIPRAPPNIDHLYSVKIDNLPYRCNMGDVERYFKRYGKVGDIYIPRDSITHESRGFAFVRYFDIRDAYSAINTMNGGDMVGRQIRVVMARNGRPRDDYVYPNRYQNDSRYDGGDNRGRRSSSYNRNRYSTRDDYGDKARSPRSPRRRRRFSRSSTRKARTPPHPPPSPPQCSYNEKRKSPPSELRKSPHDEPASTSRKRLFLPG